MAVGKLVTLNALKRFVNRLQGTMVESYSFVGARIASSQPINPAEMYGGTWELKSYHNFHGDYVYERTA